MTPKEKLNEGLKKRAIHPQLIIATLNRNLFALAVMKDTKMKS